MAHFVQLKQGDAAFRKCLNAIEKVANEACEPWRHMFMEEAEKLGHLPNMEVLLHYYKLFEDTDIKWEREVTYAQQAAWEYCNCDGIDICIGEDRGRRSHVYRSVGLPQNIVEQLEGLDNVALNQALEMYVKGHIIDSEGMELRISEYKRN